MHSSRVKRDYEEEHPIGEVLGHTFNITPQMREDVLKNGIPLYKDGGNVSRETIKGKVTLSPNMDVMQYELLTKKAK